MMTKRGVYGSDVFFTSVSTIDASKKSSADEPKVQKWISCGFCQTMKSVSEPRLKFRPLTAIRMNYVEKWGKENLVKTNLLVVVLRLEIKNCTSFCSVLNLIREKEETDIMSLLKTGTRWEFNWNKLTAPKLESHN